MKRIKTSKYKGVQFRLKGHGWIATCQINKRKYYIGWYKSELEAANAYNEFRILKQGNHAKVNQVSDLVYCPGCKKDVLKKDFYPDRANKYVKGIKGVCKKCEIRNGRKYRTNLIARYGSYVKYHFGVLSTQNMEINKAAVAQRIIKLIDRGWITFERGQQIFNGITDRKSAIATFELMLKRDGFFSKPMYRL
jgi:hypothetical protein